jgi:hypothetical protein
VRRPYTEAYEHTKDTRYAVNAVDQTGVCSLQILQSSLLVSQCSMSSVFSKQSTLDGGIDV